VTKKKVTMTSVSSTKVFPTTGLALQVEVPMVAASIPGPKVGEEYGNSDLDADNIQLEAVVVTSKSTRLHYIFY
jgi:hypothetical protein